MLSSGQNLTPYLGRYFSPEAGTHYDLVEHDGLLLAEHARHGSILLLPSAEDVFQGQRWFFGTLRFERAEDGHVSGFRLDGGRVLNLAFTRE